METQDYERGEGGVKKSKESEREGLGNLRIKSERGQGKKDSERDGVKKNEDYEQERSGKLRILSERGHGK